MNTATIKRLERVEDLKELVATFSLAFESSYNTTDEYLSSMLQNKLCVILGAVVRTRVVGGLVAFEMMPIHGTKEFYVYDIAIHPDFQKQGLGRRLMDTLKQEARTRGIGTIFVEAESDDKNAVAFYQSIGGEEVLVNHFNFNV